MRTDIDDFDVMAAYKVLDKVKSGEGVTAEEVKLLETAVYYMDTEWRAGYIKDAFVENQFILTPNANSEVLGFIRDILFHRHCGYDTRRQLFNSGYCLYFANILKSVFKRGDVMLLYDKEHVVWKDVDEIPYDIEGVVRVDADSCLIPIDVFPDAALDGYKHVGPRVSIEVWDERKAVQKLIGDTWKESGLAIRPMYIVCGDNSLYEQQDVRFQWYGRSSLEQGRKSVDSLHSNIEGHKVLEVSTLSTEVVGVLFSGCNLNVSDKSDDYYWMYVNAVSQHRQLAELLCSYDAFTDITSVPSRQAQGAALYVSLYKQGLLARALKDKEYFTGLLEGRVGREGSNK